MAGFFKKIFSFGKKEIETVPEEADRPEEAASAAEAREAAPVAREQPAIPAPGGSETEARATVGRENRGEQEPPPHAEFGPDEPRPAGKTEHSEAPPEVPVRVLPNATEPKGNGESAVSSDVGPASLGERPDGERAEIGQQGAEPPAQLAAEDLVPVPEHLENELGDAPLVESLADVVEKNLEAAENDGSDRQAPPVREGTAGPRSGAAAASEDAPDPRQQASRAAPTAFTVDAGGRAHLPAAEPQRLSWFQRLRQGLSRTSSQLTGQITGIFTRRKLDEDTLQDLEDVLIQADLGVETAMRITDALASGRYGRDIDAAEVTAIMADEIEKVLAPVARPLELDLSVRPHVILVVGVNGTGKTTTIGKLAAKLTRAGLKVTLAAGDTFRAAAIEQLRIWGERTGSTVVASRLGADAAGLAYDAYERARANGSDVLIIDTAGRLQNRTELMSELEKIVRVLGKHDPEAPHTVLQTLDATTGQNALSQVEIFRNVAGVNGLVMTKLDGTARGGILVAISARHKLPVYFIGIGEGIEDLEPFEAREFAGAIAGTPVGA